jgi:hypothetical protein
MLSHENCRHMKPQDHHPHTARRQDSGTLTDEVAGLRVLPFNPVPSLEPNV